MQQFNLSMQQYNQNIQQSLMAPVQLPAYGGPHSIQPQVSDNQSLRPVVWATTLALGERPSREKNHFVRRRLIDSEDANCRLIHSQYRRCTLLTSIPHRLILEILSYLRMRESNSDACIRVVCMV